MTDAPKETAEGLPVRTIGPDDGLLGRKIEVTASHDGVYLIVHRTAEVGIAPGVISTAILDPETVDKLVHFLLDAKADTLDAQRQREVAGERPED